MTLNWHGNEALRRLKAAAGDGLSDAAEELLNNANETVPHADGTLQGSGKPSVDRAALEATVSYNTPYAVRLHEHPEYNFQGGRRGKWLQLALQENATRLQEFMARRIREALG